MCRLDIGCNLNYKTEAHRLSPLLRAKGKPHWIIRVPQIAMQDKEDALPSVATAAAAAIAVSIIGCFYKGCWVRIGLTYRYQASINRLDGGARRLVSYHHAPTCSSFC